MLAVRDRLFVNRKTVRFTARLAGVPHPHVPRGSGGGGGPTSVFRGNICDAFSTVLAHLRVPCVRFTEVVPEPGSTFARSCTRP
eukprot:scaffold283_cov316-Pavlova_lutheri.AAC.41